MDVLYFNCHTYKNWKKVSNHSWVYLPYTNCKLRKEKATALTKGFVFHALFGQQYYLWIIIITVNIIQDHLVSVIYRENK